MTLAVKLDPSWPVALALHALLLAAILLLPRPQPFELPAEDAVPVELVAPVPEPVQLSRTPAAPAAPLAPDTEVTPKPDAPTAQRPAMVKAQSFYAAKLLADPRSRGARQALATFAPYERAIQLCNIEAMGRFTAGRQSSAPIFVVPMRPAISGSPAARSTRKAEPSGPGAAGIA